MENTLGPGPLIAVDVFFLYTILGPLILFAIYVLFDSLNKSNQNTLNKDQFNLIDQNQIAADTGRIQGTKTDKKDPALFSDEDIEAFTM